jgi:hypothetical protein
MQKQNPIAKQLIKKQLKENKGRMLLEGETLDSNKTLQNK